MADYLIDTNVLILVLRGRPSTLTLLDTLKDQGLLYISVVTRTEILAGMHQREEGRTLTLLESLISLPVTTTVADQAGRWIYSYARRGQILSVPDALIAATGFIHTLEITTTNPRRFPMPEVRLNPVAR